MHRSERRSFLEQYIYPWFGMYPWRCKFCRERVVLRDRGESRSYVDAEGRPRRRSDARNEA
jgi:hypothetical protein